MRKKILTILFGILLILLMIWAVILYPAEANTGGYIITGIAVLIVLAFLGLLLFAQMKSQPRQDNPSTARPQGKESKGSYANSWPVKKIARWVVSVILLILLIVWVINGGPSALWRWFVSLGDEQQPVATSSQSAQAPSRVSPPEDGAVEIPSSASGQYATVRVPYGWRICRLAERGADSYRAQCHPRHAVPIHIGDDWRDFPHPICERADKERLQSTGESQWVSYSFVPHDQSCP